MSREDYALKFGHATHSVLVIATGDRVRITCQQSLNNVFYFIFVLTFEIIFKCHLLFINIKLRSTMINQAMCCCVPGAGRFSLPPAQVQEFGNRMMKIKDPPWDLPGLSAFRDFAAVQLQVTRRPIHSTDLLQLQTNTP